MGNVDRVLAMVLGGFLLLPLTACSQLRPAAVSPDHSRSAVPVLEEADRAKHDPSVAPVGYFDDSGLVPSAEAQSVAPTPVPWAYSGLPSGAIDASHAPGIIPMHDVAANDTSASFGFHYASALATDATEPAPMVAASPGALFAPTDPMLLQACNERIGLGARLRSHCREGWADVRGDYRNYYDRDTLGSLLVAVGAGAALANTSLDDDFHGWYQRDVRSRETDNFSAFWKTFGEGQIFIPAYAGLALVGGLFDDRPVIGGVGDFSDRVTRGYLVGTPPMLLMQAMLGGSRPDECSVGSQWKPFDDNNAVSGHAFIGAVPFITGAKMVDNPWLKVALYTCSTFTAWSRVNDDAHYVSQICLGWWMAYMACQAVDDTERLDRCYALTPLATPEMTGLGLVVRR